MEEITEKSKVSLDIKAIIGAVVGIVSIAGVWFTLTAEIAQLQLDVIRMQDAVELNEEFRIKWLQEVKWEHYLMMKTRFTNKIFTRRSCIFTRGCETIRNR